MNIIAGEGVFPKNDGDIWFASDASVLGRCVAYSNTGGDIQISGGTVPAGAAVFLTASYDFVVNSNDIKKYFFLGSVVDAEQLLIGSNFIERQDTNNVRAGNTFQYLATDQDWSKDNFFQSTQSGAGGVTNKFTAAFVIGSLA